MRRLLPLLAVCALLLTACAEESQPDPIPLSVPEWPTTPYVSPTPTQTATPAPTQTGRAVVVDNPLYDAPRAEASCRIREIRVGNWQSMKGYLNSVSSCLDRVWSREFKRMGLPFSPPRRIWVRHRVRDGGCGKVPDKGDVGLYCSATKTYYVLIARADLDPWAAAWTARAIAHEYGDHVQTLVGIMDYEIDTAALATTSKGEDLVTRRLELQAECLAGVALRAMRRGMPTWRRFQGIFDGADLDRWVRDHGRPRTRLRWLEKGFHSGKPGVCDTWSPPARDVT
ncbi:neutral zinc metallopeptidase [Planotetraspora sp. A-T 1434]|uniref:neutral zinc metallopeptidase n=1 Tax=Planotetraspora sp. A-T 1434 TaxID=2979219 RepID=UPI0021BE143F|nr:neutral zinc metallopeptidase [Planotetraspora sp. A-T 1434]MCT9934906.1 neutral zinc metallopeptidase [Planotetraspora sp. A-T 1434]